MKRLNFKKYYGHITTDTYHDVPDEVFNILEEYRKAEQAYHSKINYHKAYYSLDRGDGIEHSALFVSLSPDEIYERKLTREQLHTAIATLPDKQAKRIYGRLDKDVLRASSFFKTMMPILRQMLILRSDVF